MLRICKKEKKTDTVGVVENIYAKNNTCNIDNMQIRQKGYSALHCTAVDVVDVTCRGRLLYISISAISYQQCNLHAEEDGECIAYQPGDAKPKQGQPLLPTAKAFNEIQCMTSYGSVSAGRENVSFSLMYLKSIPMRTMKAEKIHMTRILL